MRRTIWLLCLFLLVPAAGLCEGESPEAPAEAGPELDLGGAVRFNYAYRSFSEGSESKGGDLEFDIFRLNADARYRKLEASAEYRFYSFQNVIHHGWIGYRFTDAVQARTGVTQVPFGLLPYASHNWWFGVPYYVGLEDDYDLGAKLILADRAWDLQLAFFKNGEWGDASRTERYSFDVLRALGEENEETNQFNARAAYRFTYEGGHTEVGLSGQVGQLYNADTDDLGHHWAAAAHANAFFGPWNIMLEAARYVFEPENPPSVSDRTVVMGAFDTAFPVAAKGNLIVANASYEVPVAWDPVTKFTFYDDYSILLKDESGFESTQINTVGCLISADPVFTYVDLILGKNAPYLGLPSDPGGVSAGLAAGEEDADWETRFNVNIGYYF